MIRRAAFLTVLVLAVFPLLSVEATAAPDRFSIVAAAGLFRPSGTGIRSLYGSSGVPLSIRAAWRFWGPVSIFAGYRTMRFSGTTVVVGPSFEDERYALRLTLQSWRAGIQGEISAGRWNFRGFAGAESVAYREVWSAAAITSTGRSTGFLAGTAVDFRIVRGLGLTAVLEYDRIAAAGNGPLAAQPQVGGVEAGLGLVVKF